MNHEQMRQHTMQCFKSATNHTYVLKFLEAKRILNVISIIIDGWFYVRLNFWLVRFLIL